MCKNVNYNDCNQQKTICTFSYIQKLENIAKTFVNTQNAGLFAKMTTICIMVFNTKSKTLYVAQFFMKVLKLVFIYVQYHDTLRYVTWYIEKDREFEKKTICVTFINI